MRSKRLTLTLTKEMADRIKLEAKEKGVSTSRHARDLLLLGMDKQRQRTAGEIRAWR